MIAERSTWNQTDTLAKLLFHVEQSDAALQHRVIPVCQNVRRVHCLLISLARYTSLLKYPGLRQTYVASVLGRLPIGITGLAILLLAQNFTGSFATGGIASGCYVIGLAAMAPVIGRTIDRNGPALMLGATALLFPSALLALVVAAAVGAPLLLVFLFAAAAGALFPPITVCMRTHLKRRFGDEGLLSTAYSLESVLIELIFIVGPLLVAVFVAIATPAAAVLFAAATGAAGTILFMRSPALRGWKIEPRSRRSFLGPLADRRFVWLVAVIFGYSTAFGLMEIGVAGYATEQGSAALAGVLLGMMSAGSAVGGLAYGSRSWGFKLTRQFAGALALMGAGLAALSMPWHPLAFGFWCVVAGIIMAPALIMQAMLVAKIAAPEHSTEAFTWSTSALLSGVGAGLAAGGALMEAYDARAALAGAAGTAIASAIAAYLALKTD